MSVQLRGLTTSISSPVKKRALATLFRLLRPAKSDIKYSSSYMRSSKTGGFPPWEQQINDLCCQFSRLALQHRYVKAPRDNVQELLETAELTYPEEFEEFSEIQRGDLVSETEDSRSEKSHNRIITEEEAELGYNKLVSGSAALDRWVEELNKAHPEHKYPVSGADLESFTSTWTRE
ncbi:hypothetical protein HD806DRAFT_539723 [Xylariaceae sp. AK1471]|nr:hypothetical protein HD806DRAFT_539723 [Xylariaceae sp. AK1471]